MKDLPVKNRKELEAKLSEALQDRIDILPTELREILLDDMVEAFENRLNVLNNSIHPDKN